MGFILNPYRYTAGVDTLPVSGATLWLDAADTATIVDTSNAVTQWQDKSGNDWHVSTDTSPTDPQTNTRTVNGRNAIDFGGSASLRQGTSRQLQSSTTGDWTCFAVAVADSLSGIRFVLDADSGVRLAQFIRTNSTTPDTIAFTATTVPTTDAGNAVTTGTTRLYTARAEWGSTLEMFVDGASSAGTSLTGTSQKAGAPFVVGRYSPSLTNYWDGAICEIVVYDSALSSGDQDLVESYLADKWGITI